MTLFLYWVEVNVVVVVAGGPPPTDRGRRRLAAQSFPTPPPPPPTFEMLHVTPPIPYTFRLARRLIAASAQLMSFVVS